MPDGGVTPYPYKLKIISGNCIPVGLMKAQRHQATRLHRMTYKEIKEIATIPRCE
ncbi:hypothetical protein KCP76_11445 [Salmonella enterica subsp. enterica serovar Weltevreden]|nr:hypothetical protein KCP76_11445 [Salmonella enterica subsp. enterica serovar Weltevreden]